MANFNVDLEINGRPFTIQVQAPDEAQARAFVSQQAGSAEGSRQIFDLAGQAAPKSKGFLDQAYEALSVPEKLSRKGLGQIAEAIPKPEPTGNLAADIARGAPRIAAETLAEAAPSFISPEALLTGGVLRAGKAAAPAIKAVGRQVGKAAEAISGLEYKTPGILSEAAADPSLILSPGTKKVGQLFAEAVDKSKIRPEFARATSPKELLDSALNAADDGSLTPEEALIARQTLDGIKKSLPRYSFQEMRKSFDAVAKNVSKEADAAYKRAIKGEALRNFFAQNKLGGTSIAKSFLGTVASPLVGGGPMLAMSPLAQGSVASLLGLGARGVAPLAQAPAGVGGAVGGLLEEARRRGLLEGGR